jgi:N-acetylglucosamine-6-phosphate deacetylase
MPDRIVDGAVLAYDGKIAGLCAESDIPEGADVICACGDLVLPGLVDIHIHGYLNEDASDGKTEGVRKMAEGIAENGVTSFLPTTMTVSYDELFAAFDVVRSLKAESKSWKGAEILGVHAEGPFINPSKKGAQKEEDIRKPDAKFVLDNADIIRTITIAPEMDEGHECIKEIVRNSDVKVTMGHTAAKYEQAIGAINDGVSRVTHLFNAMTALAHRDPGVVGAALATDVYAELICDTFHIHPGVFQIIADIKKDKLVLITDSVRACGMPDGEYSLGGQPVFLKGIECRLADGTIAGSVLKLNVAVKNVLEHTTLSIPEAVAAASYNPARAIGETHKGTLKTGFDADIVIADDKMNIKKTIKRGEIIYEA